PGAVLQHGGIGRRVEPRAQERLLLAPDRARAARDGPALERAGLALADHGALDRGHRDVAAASGLSHGLTLGHRSHQAFFEGGRIGTHAAPPRTTCAWLRFPEVAPRVSRRGVHAHPWSSADVVSKHLQRPSSFAGVRVRPSPWLSVWLSKPCTS